MSEELHHDVGYIKGQVDLIVNLIEKSNDNNAKLADRIGTIENKQSYQSGMVAGIGAVFGVLGAYIQKIFSGS